jgi:hypothetical protein
LRFEELPLKLHDPPARPEPDLELIVVERFYQVVVRAGFHARDQIVFLVARCQQNDVRIDAIRLILTLAHQRTHFRPAQPRHHPIEDGHAWGIGALENLPRFGARGYSRYLIPPTAEYYLQQPARDRSIVGNEDLNGGGSHFGRNDRL